jgi:hypothetical protein
VNNLTIPPYAAKIVLTCHINGTQPFDLIEWRWNVLEGGSVVTLHPGEETGLYMATSDEVVSNYIWIYV